MTYSRLMRCSVSVILNALLVFSVIVESTLAAETPPMKPTSQAKAKGTTEQPTPPIDNPVVVSPLVGKIAMDTIDIRITEVTLGSRDSADTVFITIRSSGTEIAAFDFTIAYDPTTLDLVDALPGDFVRNCRWEYFALRRAPQCEGPCPAGLVKIVALSQYGVRRPDSVCFRPDSVAQLVKLVVKREVFAYPTATETPLAFFWTDCGDNSVSSVSGDELFVSLGVVNPGGKTITSGERDFPNFTGFNNSCYNDARPNRPVPKLFMVNSVVHFPLPAELPIADSTAVDSSQR